MNAPALFTEDVELIQTIRKVLPADDDCITLHADGSIAVLVWILACWEGAFLHIIRVLGNWVDGRPLGSTEVSSTEVVVAPQCSADTIDWVRHLVDTLA